MNLYVILETKILISVVVFSLLKYPTKIEFVVFGNKVTFFFFWWSVCMLFAICEKSNANKLFILKTFNDTYKNMYTMR